MNYVKKPKGAKLLKQRKYIKKTFINKLLIGSLLRLILGIDNLSIQIDILHINWHFKF